MGAKAILTLKVMPESVETDLKVIQLHIEKAIKEIYGEVGPIRVSDEPIAFGLRALKFEFIIDETLGSDPIEDKVRELEGVASAQVIDFRRAIG